MKGTIFTGLKLLATPFLVLLNGLFGAAEFSFTKPRSTRVKPMVQEGKTSASLVREARQNFDRYLAVCRVASPSPRWDSGPRPSGRRSPGGA